MSKIGEWFKISVKLKSVGQISIALTQLENQPLINLIAKYKWCPDETSVNIRDYKIFCFKMFVQNIQATPDSSKSQ